MPSRSRREFVVAACASVLYGARPAFATEAASGHPRIGVLLPLDSKAFGPAAEAVKRGIEAAARVPPASAMAITLHATTEDPANIVDGYQRALAEAPRLVVGPLTRDGVTALLERLQPGIPVLALNVPQTDTALPEDCYAFSLQVEPEARQVASMAFADGRRSALTVADEQPLARRTQRAFAEQFTREGGRIVAQFAFRNTVPDLMALREAATGGQCDTVFLALDPAHARFVRGYVDGPAQLYATSRILEGQPDRLRDADLSGVRFVAMPWLLQPDHPAVVVYAGANAQPPAATDMERLYAFGIDACRIAAAFVNGTDLSREPLDGVTGRIFLGRDRHFVRELVPAQFLDGRAVPLASRP
jgi:outer membrane PBP1 activator LpoA protein